VWRKTVRLGLLDLCITLADESGDQEFMNASCCSLFQKQMRALLAQGEQQCLFSFEPFGNESDGNGFITCFTGRTTQRRFGFIKRQAAADDAQHRGLRLASIVELPWTDDVLATCQPDYGTRCRGAGAGNTPQQAAEDAAADLALARKQLKMRGGAAAPPCLPKAQCVVCGEPAPKRCGACGGPPYCGAVCQHSHWKVHKAACKAARKAAQQ
jgi:hypothetical protein